MKFKCKYLEQKIIDDLFHMESQGAKGFIARQSKRFLEELPTRMTGIEIGIKFKDFDSIRYHSHKLNGLSGLLGAYEIRDITILLEQAAIDQNTDCMTSHYNLLKDTVEIISFELKKVARISERDSQKE